MKHCPTCCKNKPLDRFHRDRSRKDGRYPICAKCSQEAKARSRARSTEEQRSRHREQILKWRKDNPDAVKEHDRKQKLKKYGLSIEAYDELFWAQNEVCAICGLPETSRRKSGALQRLAIDHCELTGRVRGLLCSRCNLGIGYLKHDVSRLKNAIVYLERV